MKKIIYTLSSLILIFSLFLPMEISAYQDVVKGEDEKLDEALDLLTFLGIMSGYEDGTFKAENIVTRSESAVIIAKLLNVEITEGKDRFKDVNSDYFAYDEIYRCSEMEIIHGYDSGEFKPSEQVTYNQFIKMLVSAMGYSQYVELYGVYPTGYIKVAEELDLYKGVINKGENPLDRGSMAKILFNSLTARVFGQGIIQTEQTMIEKYHNIVPVKGIINANEYYSVDGGNTANKGYIRIDNELHSVSDRLNTDEYVGTDVNAYICIDDGWEEIVHIYPINKKSDKVFILSEDIVSYSNNKLIVEEEKRSKKYTLSSKLNVIYNGVNEINYTEDMITFKNGSLPREATYGDITIIDLDRDSIYDAVIINSYNNYFVSTIDKSNEIVYDKFRKNIKLDLSGQDNDVNIYDYKTKEIISVSDIQTDDVLAVAKSKDGKRTVVYRTNEFIEGKVSSVSEDEVDIDGEVFRISGEYLRNQGFEGFEQLTVKSSGMFYLDIHRNIAFSQLYDMGQYAFIYKIKGEDELIIKALNEFGKYETLHGAEKIELKCEDSYGNLKKKQKVEIEEFNSNSLPAYFKSLMYDGNGEFVYQVAKLEKNKEGKVSAITVFEADFDKRQAKFADSLQYVISGEKYGVGFNGIYFDIKIVDGVFDNIESSVKPIESIARNVTFNNLSLYDISRLNVARVVSIINEARAGEICADSSEINKENPIMVIQKVSSGINEDNELVYAIHGYVNGKEVVVNTVDKNVCDSVADSQYSVNAKNPKGVLYAKDLKVGDMIQYSTNLQGNMNRFRTVFKNVDEFYGTQYGSYLTRGKIMYVPNNDTSNGTDISIRRAVTPEDKDPINNDINTYFTYYSGKIIDVDSSALIINPFTDFIGKPRINQEIGGTYSSSEIEKWNKLYLVPQEVAVYKVDLEEKTVEAIPYNSVQVHDFAMVRANWQKVTEIYVIK